MHGFFLAFALDGTTLAVLAAVGIAVLGFVYFGIRFWIVSTRPANIRDVPTPNLDRLNQQALERLGNVTLEEDEEETAALQEEEAPEALKSIIPQDTPPSTNGQH